MNGICVQDRVDVTPSQADGPNERRLNLLGCRLPALYLARTNARFDRYVVPASVGCHDWTGAKDRDGYGRFRLGERVVAAHRFAYERTKGAIPEGMQVDHICTRRCCVNPDHLQVTTPEQNSALSRTRAGNSSAYGWRDAQNDGLMVDVTDLPPSELNMVLNSEMAAWVPPLVRVGWSQLGEGWNEPRFLN